MSTYFVFRGEGRVLLTLATPSAPSSATAVKAVMGVARLSRGMILRPSLAQSTSLLVLPQTLSKKTKQIILFQIVKIYPRGFFSIFNRIN